MATMWRMNGLWRRMVFVLLLCALLNHGGKCDEDTTDSSATDASATDSPDNTAATGSPAPGDTNATPDAAGTGEDASATGMAITAAPGAESDYLSIPTDLMDLLNRGLGFGGDISDTQGTDATDAPAAAPGAPPQPLTPSVRCVGKEAVTDKNCVKARIMTTDCENTKAVLEGFTELWCASEDCRLDVYQEGNEVVMASPNADQMNRLSEALKRDEPKNQLQVSEVETQPAPAGSSVFVAVLLTGLLLAAALLGGYCLKTRRRSDAKSMRLAEEAYPAEETNQGNTLVSVAPLNPPADTQEKPNVNGESTEAAKTPPTNGHSAAKTADTEL